MKFLACGLINISNQKRVLERAQLLLHFHNKTIKQIAEKVGLENLSYFTRSLKNHTGRPLGLFREKKKLQKLGHIHNGIII